MTLNGKFEQFVQDQVRLAQLGSVLSLLAWDEQVNLPTAAAKHRAAQRATLADLHHREATRPQVAEWLDALESGSEALTEDERVIVREARRDYDRSARLPSEFVRRRAEAQASAYHTWKRARENNDFSAFEPDLARNLDLAREEASYHGKSGMEAYDFHIDSHDPGMTAGSIERLFTVLREELIPLVHRITESTVRPDTTIFRGFPEADQEAFLRRVVAAFGFDFERGRIDRTVHPFCSGNMFDTRITTRYDVDNPIDSLTSSMHEAGHALYQQGLPAEYFGTGLGEHVGMAVHESQSRLWENQVGRSRSFWKYWEPEYRAAFPRQLQGVSSDQFYLALNAVAPTPIRVDADEVTYNLHILLRFELEKRLFDGTLETRDLPAAWCACSQELLGHTPRDFREGVLQDVHWSIGAFGYFPSYCLGNMLAAQIWYAARDALPDMDRDFEQGVHQPLLEWLRANVHRHGKRYTTPELTQRVTGAELGPESLIRYLKERYLPLYT